MDKVVYIALPYSNDDPQVREFRYLTAAHYFEKLATKGIVSISPIVMGHPLAKKSYSKLVDVPYEFWVKLSMHMIKPATELHVLCLDGWEKSTGTNIEIEYAVNHNIPVVYIKEQDVWC